MYVLYRTVRNGTLSEILTLSTCPYTEDHVSRGEDLKCPPVFASLRFSSAATNNLKREHLRHLPQRRAKPKGFLFRAAASMEPHFNEPVRGPAHSPVLQSVGRLPIEPMDPMLTDNAHRSFGTQAQYQTCMPVNGLDVQPDPSTKRQLAREDQYFDNHYSLAPSRATTILRPSMASSPERRFGAICFNPISSTLSRSYVVELPADGPAIQSLSPELEKLEQDPQFGPQVCPLHRFSIDLGANSAAPGHETRLPNRHGSGHDPFCEL
jgi:hypothetical protein